MNYGKVLDGLNEINFEKDIILYSKGIMLSIHDFHGNIELHKNLINNNMIYIPSATYTNHPKFDREEFIESANFDHWVKNF